jgi:uncharacterized protein YoaH (UPF0181 family)
MKGERASADQQARRVNAAAELLSSGQAVAEVARQLAQRYRLSERQARRYVERAQQQGRMAVPQPSVAFTVKLPAGLLSRLRSYARDSGRTLSGIVSQAIEELLERVRAGSDGG